MLKPRKRCLLLQPPSGLYRRDDRCQSKVNDQTVQIIFPPIYLATLAAVLEDTGVECRIFDGSLSGLDWKSLEATFETFQPDMLVIGTTMATFEQDARAVEIAKRICGDVLTVARGEIFMTEDEACLSRMPDLDVVIRGESELPVRDLGRGMPPEEIRGVTYRNGDRVFRTANRPLPEDLDRFPYPARHLLDNARYLSPESRKPLTVIQTSRGCEARCIFCPAWTFSGRHVRMRSPENILGEIRECLDRYGIDEFYFNADTFTYDKDWTIRLCKAILDAGLKIRWGCNSRVDTIDSERLEWMKKAGCWVVGFGIETGSEESLQLMGKHTTLEQARRAVRMCKEADMRVHTFFVIGFPWETREHVNQTIAFACELDPDFFDFNLATPLPGTPLWNMVQRENLWAGSEGSYAKASVRTKSLSADELTQLRRRALWRLYLRPRYIWRTLRNAGPLPKKLNYLRAALSRVRGLLVG